MYNQKLKFILNDIINLNFNKEKVSQFLNNISDVDKIMSENDIEYTCLDSRNDFIIDIAKDLYFERIEQAQYIHSLS